MVNGLIFQYFERNEKIWTNIISTRIIASNSLFSWRIFYLIYSQNLVKNLERKRILYKSKTSLANLKILS